MNRRVQSGATIAVGRSLDDKIMHHGQALHMSSQTPTLSPRRTIEAAELEPMDRRVVTIPAVSRKKFEAWAAQPAKSVPALRRLAGDEF